MNNPQARKLCTYLMTGEYRYVSRSIHEVAKDGKLYRCVSGVMSAGLDAPLTIFCEGVQVGLTDTQGYGFWKWLEAQRRTVEHSIVDGWVDK